MIVQDQLGEIEASSIWRYMSFERFSDLIRTKSLYFCPITYYQMNDDPLEASMTEDYKQTYETNFKYRTSHKEHFFRPKFANPSSEFNALCERIFINCWHQNTIENFAFWKIYGSKDSHESIAIVSTPQKLLRSIMFGGSHKELNTRMTATLFIKKVDYIDHFRDSFGKTNEEIDRFQPFFYKHVGYQYENEIRALLYFHSDGVDLSPFNAFSKTKKIKIDLCELITEIRLGFKAPPDFKRKVQELIASNGLCIPTLTSELNIAPIWPN